MAENGASESIGSILQNWSNIGNLFVAFVIAGLVPVLKHFGKKYQAYKQRKLDQEMKEEKEAITEIAKEVQAPVIQRIDRIEGIMEKYAEQNERLLDHMNIIEQLLQGKHIGNSSTTTRRPGRPSKHFDHSTGKGDRSD